MSVHQLPRLTIRAPAIAFTPTQRVSAAYQLVEQAEAHLREGDDDNSGLLIIARAAIVTLSNRAGVEVAAARLDGIAEVIGSTPKGAA